MRRIAALLALLAAAPGAAAEDFAKGDPAGDQILFNPPDGWSPAQQEKGESTYHILYLPEGSTVDDWQWSLKVQIFFNLAADRPDLSAADFTENLVRFYAASCDASDASPVSAFDEYGYQAAARVVVCPRLLGEARGSVTMLKVMRGRASYFMVERTWRGPAFTTETTPVSQATLDDWAEFLTTAWLCNPAVARRPCPPGVAQ